MRRARLAFAAFLALGTILIAAPVAQADEGWVITSFHSDIAIAADSTLTVTEDVRVDFGSVRKHGIFRTIPLRYRFDSTQDRVYQLEVQSVTDGSKPLPYDDYISSD